MLKHPKFLAVGHLSFDVNIVDGGSPSDRIPGGASAYATLVAKKHGISSGILTSMGDDYPVEDCLLYTSPSPRDRGCSRMPSSA